MTNQHPLTDEMIEEIAHFEPDLTDPLRLNTTNDIRASADWQLKRVIEFLQRNHEPDNKYTLDTVALVLKGAMRPQQQENNQ